MEPKMNMDTKVDDHLLTVSVKLDMLNSEELEEVMNSLRNALCDDEDNPFLKLVINYLQELLSQED